MIALLAAAVIPCLPTPDMHKLLAEEFNALPAVVGMSKRGTALEIWTAPDGFWVGLVTRTDGTSCLFDGGEKVHVIRPTVPGEPA